ncbi:MAG: FtsQ-type POTRA domain-containing protein [Thermodesulfobacteriota bacterium]
MNRRPAKTNGLSLSRKPSRNRYRESRVRGKGLAGAIKGLLLVLWNVTRLVFGGAFALSMLGLVSMGLMLGYYYLMNSEYFMVRKVVLEGLNRVSRNELLSRTGLDQPANILALRLDKMAARARALSWVETVTITRRMPDTILVQIREHRPRTLISLGDLYYLDENGQPIKKVGPMEKPELPIVTGFAAEDFEGPRLALTRKDVEEVFALLEVMAERNDSFRVENISEINFDPVRGISLFTRHDNIQVKIGLGDYRTKLWRLGRLMALLKIKGQADGLNYFNLECGPRVIARRSAAG